MGDSFYGGPKGKDFKISRVFHNKKEMMDDLQLRWYSKIGVGEYVIISYGMPNNSNVGQYDKWAIYDTSTNPRTFVRTAYTQFNEYPKFPPAVTGSQVVEYLSTVNYLTSYVENREIDYRATRETKSYNSTIWEKIYTESTVDKTDELTGIEVVYASGNFGLGYKLLASMTGNTPMLEAYTGDPLDADAEAKIEFNCEDIDNPFFVVRFPKTPVWHVSSDNTKDADYSPTVWFNNELKANGDKKYPSNYNADNPLIRFDLPQQPELGLGDTEVIAPLDPPKVELKNKRSDGAAFVNNPKLFFKLPRAAKFYYGTALGKTTDSLLPNPGGYKAGDYYINSENGFIYEITAAATGMDCVVQFVARLSTPIPEIEDIVTIDPYKPKTGESGYEKAVPSIVSVYADPDKETGWNLTFQLPDTPNFVVDSANSSVEFIGADAAGSGAFDGKILNTTDYGISYEFEIPRGARFFTGTAMGGDSGGLSIQTYNKSAAADGEALVGDFYINTTSGYYYKLVDNAGTLVWQWQADLTGPVGERLKFACSTVNITPAQVATFNKDAIGAYIISSGALTTYPSDSEIVPVNYEDSLGVLKSYYFFYVDGAWNYLVVSGDAARFANDRQPDDSARAYSITYVNGLEEQLSWGSISDLITP